MSHWMNGCQSSFVSSLGAGNMLSVSQSLGCALELDREQDFVFPCPRFHFQVEDPSLRAWLAYTTRPTVSACTPVPGSWPAGVWMAGKWVLLLQGCRATRTQVTQGLSVPECNHRAPNRGWHSGSGQYWVAKASNSCPDQASYRSSIGSLSA